MSQGVSKDSNEEQIIQEIMIDGAVTEACPEVIGLVCLHSNAIQLFLHACFYSNRTIWTLFLVQSAYKQHLFNHDDQNRLCKFRTKCLILLNTATEKRIFSPP